MKEMKKVMDANCAISKYLPVVLHEVKYFRIKLTNRSRKLFARYSKMDDGVYVKSYYLKLGGPLHQIIISESEFLKMKQFAIAYS